MKNMQLMLTTLGVMEIPIINLYCPVVVDLVLAVSLTGKMLEQS